ncbi:glycosyl hydrolase family 28-related protein [Lysobacter sp. CA199]|uniref:glycosyl hydrolase family 28-related protein n=1 Tax=Lysobacter sp. CA199 TaxID=3455608 RepID=UPI003F8D0A3C
MPALYFRFRGSFRRPLPGLGLGVLLTMAAAAAPAATGVALLDDPAVACAHPLPDFSYAGYGFGLAPLPRPAGRLIDVRDYGAKADDEIDDSKALLKAFAAAHAAAGPVIVQLPPGRLILSEVLRIERGDFVLRGHGPGRGGSELYIPRPLRLVDRGHDLDELRAYLDKYDKRQVEPERNIDLRFSEYSWSGGFVWIQKPGTRPAAYLPEHDPPSAASRLAWVRSGQRGQRQLRVDSTRQLAVGAVVQLRWFNRDGKNGALLKALYGDTELEIGSHHWTFPDRPLVRQSTRIVAIDGDTVTVADPLLHDAGGALRADLGAWEHLREVGIEDLAIAFPAGTSFGHHLEQGYNAIYLTSVFDGWVRDVRIANSDSGILTGNSASVTIADVTTEGERAAHYAVHIGNVHNVLVSDLRVLNPVVHPLSINTQASKSVFLRAQVFGEPAIDQHAGANHQNLFDQLSLHVRARRDDKGAWYPLWNGSGAGYWEPGHGRFNTHWNLRVQVEAGATAEETVRLVGGAEGPDARVVGVAGNRRFQVDYFPRPYLEGVNTTLAVPSLYQYQLQRRREGAVDANACPPAGARSASR